MEFADVPINSAYRVIEDQDRLFAVEMNPVRLGGGD
jgi:hypothetical protein